MKPNAQTRRSGVVTSMLMYMRYVQTRDGRSSRHRSCCHWSHRRAGAATTCATATAACATAACATAACATAATTAGRMPTKLSAALSASALRPRCEVGGRRAAAFGAAAVRAAAIGGAIAWPATAGIATAAAAAAGATAAGGMWGGTWGGSKMNKLNIKTPPDLPLFSICNLLYRSL